MIARVVVDISLDREFDYLVPHAFENKVFIGSRVSIPFGRRHTSGYVVGLLDRSDHAKLKPISDLVSDKPYIDDSILKLARWMSDYYCAPLEACIRTVLPGAVRRKHAKFKSERWVVLGKVESEKRKAESGSTILRSRLRPGIAGASPSRSAGGGTPSCRNEAPAEPQSNLNAKQTKVLEILKDSGGEMPLSALLNAADVSESPIKTLAKHELVSIESRDAMRDPLKNNNILTTAPLVLMPEQAEALELIKQKLDDCPRLDRSLAAARGRTASKDAAARGRTDSKDAAARGRTASKDAAARGRTASRDAAARGRTDSRDAAARGRTASRDEGTRNPILLYGVTGSGKTEVYLQAIAHALELGKGAIVLVPEISLTPQTIRRFQSRFGDKIAVLHSHLSEGERHDEWHRIRDGKASVVIGARSAVFAPVRNLGLIVVDEEHEPSYKQSEAPRYHARDVAVMRGHIANCAVVLGSATPAMESWANTKNGKYDLSVLPRRADDRKMPAVRIIDMRIEAERTGHVNVFSQDLLKAIEMRLNEGEQTMLFLNRRGYSSSLICPKCGFVSECNQCSVSHTFHQSDNSLRCHICGGSAAVPAKCPECSDPAFKFAGMGTQRVESIVRKCFKHARIARMDADTTTRKEAYNEILGAFRDGKIDILVGTQMIAKGLHFPNVTLVGVVYADLSLHMPDFRAGERTFQLLAQVAGRAGRGDVAGEVIVQTYTPHHVAVQAARQLDYEGFCAEEIEFRKELHYPPAAHLTCITLKGKKESEVQYCTEVLAKRLRAAAGNRAIVSDACPAPLSKAKGYYRFQIITRSKSVRAVSSTLKSILAELHTPRGVAVAVDVDAIDLM